MKIFITGISGMIGYHLALLLNKQGHTVWGIDNYNHAYDVRLKRDRTEILTKHGIQVFEDDIRHADYQTHFQQRKPSMVIHLAALAHPRHSLTQAQAYIDNNITGTQTLIDALETYQVPKVIYASTSCVMHGQPLPWKETDQPHHQNNPYGWSKRVNECQFHHSKVPQTSGIRFFTVYGEYGRPDTAIFEFTRCIINGEPIQAYNYGNMWRDWTYVGDICQGVHCVIKHMCSNEILGHEMYNLGCGQQVNLMNFIHEIETQVGRKALVNLAEAHPADVPSTWADTTKIQKLGYTTTTHMSDGVRKFVNWYQTYYQK